MGKALRLEDRSAERLDNVALSFSTIHYIIIERIYEFPSNRSATSDTEGCVDDFKPTVSA